MHLGLQLSLFYETTIIGIDQNLFETMNIQYLHFYNRLAPIF